MEEGSGRKWIFGEDARMTIYLRFQIRLCDFLNIFLRLFGEYDNPFHQRGFVEDLVSGSAMTLRMESCSLGMEVRYKVSWILRQSASEIRIASLGFPVI